MALFYPLEIHVAKRIERIKCGILFVSFSFSICPILVLCLQQMQTHSVANVFDPNLFLLPWNFQQEQEQEQKNATRWDTYMQTESNRMETREKWNEIATANCWRCERTTWNHWISVVIIQCISVCNNNNNKKHQHFHHFHHFRESFRKMCAA